MAPRSTKLIKGDKGKMLQANDAKMRGRAENAKSKIFKNLANPDGGKTGMGLDDENAKLKNPPITKMRPKKEGIRGGLGQAGTQGAALADAMEEMKKKKMKMKEGSGIGGLDMGGAPDSNVEFEGGLKGGGMVKKYKKGGKVRGAGIARQGVRKTKYI
jgi:hypothetical protein